MLRLSKKADYALIAMKHLALHGDRGSSSAREIAEQYDIPIELMAKVTSASRAAGTAGVASGNARRLSTVAASEADFGRRRDSSHRRSGDRDRVLDRR